MCESSCTIKRPTIGQDAEAGTTQDPFVIIMLDLPCSQQEASSRTQELYGQRNIFVSTTFYFPVDPRAEVNDLILSTDRTGATVKYLVQGAQQPVGRGRIWSVDCERVREPE